MNLKVRIAIVFMVFLLSKGCEMSFPRGATQAAGSKDCIPVIEGGGQITSITAYGSSGEIIQLGLNFRVVNAPAQRLEAAKSAVFHILLDFPPRYLKSAAVREALDKKFYLFVRYLDRICAGEKYDKILSISVQTLKGMQDLTASFLADKRTSLTR